MVGHKKDIFAVRRMPTVSTGTHMDGMNELTQGPKMLWPQYDMCNFQTHFDDWNH